MTELGYMVVRDVESTVKIHISEISFLIVGSTSVSLYGKQAFSGVEKEKVTYIDNDLCEIVDNGN